MGVKNWSSVVKIVSRVAFATPNGSSPLIRSDDGDRPCAAEAATAGQRERVRVAVRRAVPGQGPVG